MPDEQPIRPAATVMILREAAPGFEVFMLRRTRQAVFAGGMYVFPGGRVDTADHGDDYAAVCVDPGPDQALQREALGKGWRGFWVAGIRECFEEAGLLLAYREDGSLLEFADDAERARIDGYRAPLHGGALSLREICEREGLRLALDRIHFVTRVVTPPGRPRRFDTRFFMAEAPAGQAGRHDGHETVDSLWISPQQALARHAAEQFGLMSVTHRQLQDLSEHDSQREAMTFAAARRTFTVSRPRRASSD